MAVQSVVPTHMQSLELVNKTLASVSPPLPLLQKTQKKLHYQREGAEAQAEDRQRKDSKIQMLQARS